MAGCRPERRGQAFQLPWPPTIMAVRTVGGIEDIARQGLIELNRIVGALRRDEHEVLDRRPQP